MTAALDYSPGGCCCDGGGFYDMFSYGGAAPLWPENGNLGKFARACTMFAVGSAARDARRTSYPDWYIEPAKPLTRWISTTTNGQIVWSQPVATDGTSKFRVYDAAAKTQLAEWDLPASNFTSISYSSAYHVIETTVSSQNAYIVYNVNGSATTHFATLTTAEIEDPDATGTFRRLVGVATLDWPKAYEVKRVFTPGVGTVVQLRECTVEFDPTKSFGFRLNDGTIVRQIEYGPPLSATTFPGTFAVKGFDRLGGVSAVAYSMVYSNNIVGTAPPSSLFRNEIAIGSDIVFAQSGSTYDSLFSAGVHVCYPHESLGGGYVAVSQNVFVPPNRSSVMRVYTSGGIEWSSPYLLQILGSTDRWIYFKTNSAVSVSAVTNSEFTATGGGSWGLSAYWIAKHDGSQIMPLGVMQDTYKQIQILGTNSVFNQGANIGDGANSFARDSSLFTDTLPATYDEMYARRTQK